jgi:hypothetical protein
MVIALAYGARTELIHANDQHLRKALKLNYAPSPPLTITYTCDIVVSSVIFTNNAVPSIPVAPARKTSRAPKACSNGFFSPVTAVKSIARPDELTMYKVVCSEDRG